jgi:hypothetical protein
MEDNQYVREANDAINTTIDNWSSEKCEDKVVRMMRALLNLHAFSLDYQRVLRGERPIRTSYPLPLPAPVEKEIKIETIYEGAYSDGYKHFGSGRYFLEDSDAQIWAAEKYNRMSISPKFHKAIKLSEGEYVILSGEPVCITGSAKEKEYIAKKALAKLSKEEREALGI